MVVGLINIFEREGAVILNTCIQEGTILTNHGENLQQSIIIALDAPNGLQSSFLVYWH